MVKITAIIRPSKLEAVKESLGGYGLKGLTVSQVTGAGLQQGKTAQYRGNKYEVNLLPKVKIEIVVNSESVEDIIKIITKEARTGEIGDGKIFISSIDDVIRIRTGERGAAAL
jgi:nitrogen regulatory protein P-II 1